MTTSHILRTMLTRCLVALLMLGGLTSGLAAQEVQRVAAVVNEEIISMHDLEMRLRLVLLSSNQPDSVDSRRRVASQVLRKLIDERLQIQEADRLKVVVGPGEVANGVANIERQNNMERGTFEPMLKSKGIDPETLRQQVRAELSWVKVMRRELLPDVKIGEEEIDARLATLKANLGKPEYLAAEIFLPIDNPRHEEETRALGDRLLEQMKQGAAFSGLARQFSQTGGSAGGDLGWVSAGMLDEELTTVLSRLEPGTVSRPVRTLDGIHLMLLRDKRIAGQTGQAEPIFDIGMTVINSLPSSTPAEREDQAAKFRDIAAHTQSCDDYPKALKALPAAEWARPGKVKPSEVPREVLALIGDLHQGEVSQPLTIETGKRYYIMCSRVEASNGMPSRDDIRQRLEDERMDILAKRYLRDVRRAAFVEIRV